ncbi:MAG TPA: hypothetical protein VKH19_09860 [Gemmatimonadaceae bacterium]|nr:hypothetical protein [Gemmatimonadaceae bacterium]
MKHLALAAVLLSTACARVWSPFRSTSDVRAEAAVDSMYWRAVAHLSPNNRNGSRDSAVTLLDTYLKSSGTRKHITEAATLLDLAKDAQQLARVQAALQQARADADRPRSDSSPSGRDESAVKEIERLKSELARANEELERIKKRLAAPAKP